MMAPPLYEARLDYLISALPAEQTSGYDLDSRAWLSTNRSDTYAQILTSRQVLQPVIWELGLDTTVGTLAETVEVSIPYDTSILSVVVVNRDASLATDIGRAIAQRAPQILVEMDREDPEAPARMAVTALADGPTVSEPSPWRRWAGPVLGGLVGLGATVAGIRRHKDIRSSHMLPDDIHAALSGLPVLGGVTMPSESAPGVADARLHLHDRLAGLPNPVAVIGTTRGLSSEAAEAAWDVLTAGTQDRGLLVDVSRTELRGPELSAQLHRLEERYARVWITGPSLASVDHASTLLSLASAVVLLIPAKGAAIDDLTRTCDLVARAQVPVVGAVMVHDHQSVDRRT